MGFKGSHIIILLWLILIFLLMTDSVHLIVNLAVYPFKIWKINLPFTHPALELSQGATCSLDHSAFSPLSGISNQTFKAMLKYNYQINMQHYVAFETFPHGILFTQINENKNWLKVQNLPLIVSYILNLSHFSTLRYMPPQSLGMIWPESKKIIKYHPGLCN